MCNAPHDHEGAFTIDRCGGNLNEYGVTNPHVEGNILNKTLLSSLDREIFDVVKVEHINHCLLSSPFTRYQILNVIFTLLKPGGTAIFLTGGEDHLHISLEEAEGCFEVCGFQVQEASHYKKVPLCSVEIFNSYSDVKKRKLVDQILLSNDRTYWRKISEEEKKLYSNPIFGHYGYYEINAVKPTKLHEEQL